MHSKRETIPNSAISLIAEQGYSAVSLDDIGAHSGTTGPNLYNYFPSKADILIAGFQRGTEWLHRDLAEALELARDHTDALHRLIRAYATFNFNNSKLIGPTITEIDVLPAAKQSRGRRMQHDYIAEWVHILRAVHPDFSDTAARIRVQAWFTIVNDIARTVRLRGTPGVLGALGCRVLAIPVHVATSP